MTEYKNIAIVNERDEVIGAVPLFEAIEKNLIRRSARVCVFNESGQMLIQKRSAYVIRPLLQDISVAGHVDEGEEYETAALRELAEELAIYDVELITVVTSWRSQSFFSGIFKVTVPDDISITTDENEVESTTWFFPQEIDLAMKVTPESFCPEFIETWQLLRDKILNA